MSYSRVFPLIFKRNFIQGVAKEPSVLVQRVLGSGKLILNAPRRLNAIDLEMVDGFYPYMKMWEESEAVKNIIIKGNGRAFCAGGDVKDVIQMVKDPNKHAKLAHQIDTEYEMVHLIGTMKTPYIAIMDGITMGAGGGLSCPAPFRIATENTQFAMPETSIGLFCDVGASFFLSRLDDYLGTYMGLTSRVVKAEDTLFSGIATHFVPSARLDDLEAQLAKIESKYDHDVVHQVIEEFAVDKNYVPGTYTLHGEHRRIISQCFKYGTAEEIIRALQENGSKFALETMETILKRSPTSVKITLEHLRQGSKASWMDCLRMEHRLWQTIPFAHDFVEGVTSHVVLKKAPKWNPPRLEDLDLDGDVRAKYFYSNVKRHLFFRNQEDYYLHPYRRFALPSEDEILHMKSLHNLKTVQETVEWFEKDRNGKFGVRQKVEDVLNRQN